MVSIFKNPFLSIAGQKERLANVVGVVNAAFNPFSKSTVQANISNPTMKSGVETFANHPYVSAGVLAGGYTAITKPALAGTIAKAAIPKTVKGKIIAGIATPIVIGAIAKAPSKAAKIAIEAPSQLTQFGGGITQLITEPSLEHAKELFKESPILTSATLAAGAVIAGKGIFPAIAEARHTKAIKEQTAAIEAATGALAIPTEKPNYQLSPVGVAPLSPTVPVTPQTKTITAGTTKITRRKAKKVKALERISQRVNVLISNRNVHTNKRFINREALAY